METRGSQFLKVVFTIAWDLEPPLRSHFLTGVFAGLPSTRKDWLVPANCSVLALLCGSPLVAWFGLWGGLALFTLAILAFFTARERILLHYSWSVQELESFFSTTDLARAPTTDDHGFLEGTRKIGRALLPAKCRRSFDQAVDDLLSMLDEQQGEGQLAQLKFRCAFVLGVVRLYSQTVMTILASFTRPFD